MKKIILASLFTSISLVALAQPNTKPNKMSETQRQEKLENIEQMRVALITQQLNLTTEQAEKFWPIYNRYSAELKQMRQAKRATMQNAKGANASDDDAQKAMTAMIELKQSELDLQKKYQSEFLRVICAKQLLSLHQTNQKFNKELLNRLQQRRHGAGGMRDGMRGRNGGWNQAPRDRRQEPAQPMQYGNDR